MLLGSNSLEAQEINSSDKEKINEYMQKIEEFQKKQNKNRVQEFANKLAFIYWQNLHYEEALKYFDQSLKINKEMGNKNGVKHTNYYIGMIYSEKEDYKKAIEYFEKGVSLSRELNTKSSLVSGLINMAQSYQNMGNYKMSNEKAMEALEISKELENMKFIRNCYGLLSENHESLGNSKKSMEYFDLFSSIDKHIKNKEVSEIKKETQDEVSKAKSVIDKKEKELAQEKSLRKKTEDSLKRAERINRERQMQLELKEMALKKKKAQLKLNQTIRNSFIFGFVLVSIFTVLLFHFYRQKKKANILLSEQNEKINNQNIKIEEQRNKLQIQNTKLNDSINYAQNIQTAILPDDPDLEKFFEKFVLFKPKDIVSGDFYWFTEINDEEVNKIFLAVVDCTGHGVPGAFMSMIGNRVLNEIISEKRVYEPSKILALLNQHVIEALKQEYSENADGMDVCLIRMDKTSNPGQKIYFSGAKRPLYHYSTIDRKIHTTKGDRFSIGGISKKKDKKQKNFTTHEINVSKGDILYLTTDGMIDQVNSNGKRFTSKRLLDALNKYAEYPLEKQKNVLNNSIEDFKGNTEQRDDITVIGAKIR
jgi:serine phosphatase RsbU (regulator of sigma subunit)